MARFILLMFFTAGLTLMTSMLQAEEIKIDDPSRGKIIYDAHCGVCHGPAGKGDGPSVHALIPRPPDFTDVVTSESLSKDRIMDVITNGKPKTQMEAWKDRLSLQDIREVMEYVQSLR